MSIVRCSGRSFGSPFTLRLLFLILNLPPAITPTESPDNFDRNIDYNRLVIKNLNKISMEDLVTDRMILNILKDSFEFYYQ